MLRALVIQLYYTGLPNVQKPLNEYFSLYENGKEQPSLQSLCIVFQRMVQEASELWIVLDALDECPNTRQQRRELLSWIETFYSEVRNIHLLVTSRTEEDIESTMKKEWASGTDVITLRNDLVAQDILSYVRWELSEGELIKQWRNRPEVQRAIFEALINKANGG
jgi:hypothetical protein